MTEIPGPATANDAPIPADFASPEPEPAAEAEKRGRGRPPKGETGRTPPFFEHVAAIPKEDWGTRAFIYVYATEPIVQANTFGKSRYMLKSSAPILDLEQLKRDYGSFKGFMTLNWKRNPATHVETCEVNRFGFEIYEVGCPPKIPKSAWMNDPRNKRWADLLPPDKPSSAEAAAPMLEAIKVYKEIRDDVKQEVGPPTDSPRPNEVIETMRAAKELFAPAASTTTAPQKEPDAFDTAKKIMDMRSNDPMVDMLLKRMDAQDRALEASRQREFELQKQMLEARMQPAQAPKTLAEQLKELASLKDLLKEVLGGAEAAGTVVKTGKTTWLDLVQNVVPQIFQSEFMANVGQRIAASAVQQPANPALSQQRTPAAGPGETTEAAFQRWIGQVVNKQVVRYFIHMRLGGDDLADLLYAMEPEWTVRLQNFEHPQLPGMKGKAAILAAYRVTPSVWPQIEQSGRAQEFEQFVEAFCNWKPEADDSTASPEHDGVIDLTASTVGRGPDGEQTEATEA